MEELVKLRISHWDWRYKRWIALPLFLLIGGEMKDLKKLRIQYYQKIEDQLKSIQKLIDLENPIKNIDQHILEIERDSIRYTVNLIGIIKSRLISEFGKESTI